MKELKDELSDEDLMELYQSGDALAFEALYERHSGKVFAFLQKKANPQVARDLLQETFLKLHRSRQQYSPQYPFLPWIFTIARNAYLDFVRLNETKITQQSSVVDVPATQPEPEEAWDANLSQALSTLPTNQKRAIELRYISEWTFEQIAAEMKTSPVNARQLISRSLKKLRSSLGASDE